MERSRKTNSTKSEGRRENELNKNVVYDKAKTVL